MTDLPAEAEEPTIAFIEHRLTGSAEMILVVAFVIEAAASR